MAAVSPIPKIVTTAIKEDSSRDEEDYRDDWGKTEAILKIKAFSDFIDSNSLHLNLLYLLSKYLKLFFKYPHFITLSSIKQSITHQHCKKM